MAKILLVEDDPLMIRMYQRKLLNDGYEVEIAVNGEEGLVKIRSFVPDLVLLDIMMPKLNGLQVLERMKADPSISKIPVVILTNLAGSQEDIERGLELGAVAYLVKSAYRPDQVLGKVKEVLAGYTRSKEVPKASDIEAALKVQEATGAAQPTVEAPRAQTPPPRSPQSDMASQIRDILHDQLPSTEAPAVQKPVPKVSQGEADDSLVSKLREILAGQMAPASAASPLPQKAAEGQDGADLLGQLKSLLTEQRAPSVEPDVSKTKTPPAPPVPSASKIPQKRKLSDHELVEALKKLLTQNE
mgnify:CR=1 FL=1